MQGDINSVVDFINQVLAESGLELTASSEPLGQAVRVQVRGGDRPVLLGHNAELLDALEHIGNRMLAHVTGEEHHLVFDSGSYRAQREKELQLMAEKAAERVRSTRKPFTFAPMSPGDRRVIHLALSEDGSVRSESQGSGDNRKVTIYPSK